MWKSLESKHARAASGSSDNFLESARKNFLLTDEDGGQERKTGRRRLNI